MPELLWFTADNLPEHFACQIRDFVRILWFDAYFYDLDSPIHPVDWHPLYFVLAQKHVVVSAAAVVWKPVNLNGDEYTVYGLSSVLTYPAFRNRGFGQQVVNTATEYIVHQQNADLAILWTGHELERFYGQCGWEYPDTITVTAGDPAQPSPTDFPMMLFLSDRAQRIRPMLERNIFYFGQYTW